MAADFGSPIVNPQGSDFAGNTLKTLSGVLGIKQAQQNLQLGQAELQQRQQDAQQRAGIAQFFQNYDLSKHVGADGTLNLDDALTNPQLRQAAGDKFPEVVSQLLNVKQGQLVAKKSLLDLNDTARKQFGEVVGGLRTDPDVVAGNDEGKRKASLALGQWAATGPDAARVAAIYGPALENTPSAKLAQALSNVQLQAMDAATQASKQAPSFLSTGAQNVNVAPQAAGGLLGPQGPIQQEVAPGIHVWTDAAGNPRATNVQTPGESVQLGQGGSLSLPHNATQETTRRFTQAVRGGAEPTKELWDQTKAAVEGRGPDPINKILGLPQPGERPPVNVPGQEDVNASIKAARDASAQVGVNRDINKKIIELSKRAITGPGAGWIGDAATVAGLSAGASTQELGAFLDRQAAMAANSMGLPHTNAGMEAAGNFTGTPAYDAKVIRDKTLFADALNTGAQAYRKGMEKVLGSAQNPDYASYQKFRAQWADAFSPQAFAYLNAKKSGDDAEAAKIEKFEGEKGMAELRSRLGKLRNLIDGKLE